jgi:hypothetical protein
MNAYVTAWTNPRTNINRHQNTMFLFTRGKVSFHDSSQLLGDRHQPAESPDPSPHADRGFPEATAAHASCQLRGDAQLPATRCGSFVDVAMGMIGETAKKAIRQVGIEKIYESNLS